MFTIIILIAIYVSLSLAYNKLNRGSTPRYHVTCKDLSDYYNRIGRARDDYRHLLRDNKFSNYKEGYLDYYLIDGRWISIDRVHDEYNQLTIMNNALGSARRQFHKTCEERGINRMKAEYLDKPHI